MTRKEKQEKERIRKRAERRKRKLTVFKYYSKSEVPHCKLCNFNNIKALTIDHINNDGAEQRKVLGRASDKIYGWLIAKSFPDQFQVLCFNCQIIKRYGDKDYLEDSVNTRFKQSNSLCTPELNTKVI